VLPGLDLTHESAEPEASGHAVALGLRRFVGMGAGLEEALRAARAEGAALVAYLRSPRPAYLVRLVGAPQLLLAA
jgi:hypothetical protein